MKLRLRVLGLLCLAIAPTALAGPVTITVSSTCFGDCTGVGLGFVPSAEMVGLGTATLTGYVDAYPYSWAVIGPFPYTSFFGSVSLLLNAYTDGPVRAGYLDVSYSAFGYGRPDPVECGGRISQAPGVNFSWRYEYGYAQIPFSLGMPFDVQLNASAWVTVFDLTGRAVASRSNLTLRAFDLSNGSYVNILGAPETGVPEPSGLGLTAVLMLAIAAWKPTIQSSGRAASSHRPTGPRHPRTAQR